MTSFYCTTETFLSEDKQNLPVSSVIEITGTKSFILKSKWSKGPKKYIEYWFRLRKVELSELQKEKFLIPFNIDLDELRLE